MTPPQRRRMPPERHLQALDLNLNRHAGSQSYYANDEYTAGGHYASTPRHAIHETRDKHRDERDSRTPRPPSYFQSSDYDYNIPQSPSRSWSMIDLPSVRRRQMATRIKGGGDPYGCGENNNEPEEEPADFYYSGHPGVDLSPESPEFLSIDAYQRQSPSQRPNSYSASTPFRPMDTSMYSSDPSQRRRMPQRRLDFSPSTNNPCAASGPGSCVSPNTDHTALQSLRMLRIVGGVRAALAYPFGSPGQSGSPAMDRYRDMRSGLSQPPMAASSPPPASLPPLPVSSAWQPPSAPRQQRAVTDLQMGRSFDYSMPNRQVQTGPARLGAPTTSRRPSQPSWESPYRQQNMSFMRDSEPFHMSSYKGPIPMYANIPMGQSLPPDMSSFGMGPAATAPSSLEAAFCGSNAVGSTSMGSSAMGSSSMGAPCMGQNGMGQNGMGQNGMGQNGMGQNGMGEDCMNQNRMGQNGMGQNGMGQNGMGQNGMGQNGSGQNGGGSTCPGSGRGKRVQTYSGDNSCLAASGPDLCARQCIQLPPCLPKQKPEKCAGEREAMQCLACGKKQEEVSTAKECAVLSPKIAAKMDKCLPKFCIPRGMEEEFGCKKRRELWDSLVRDSYCPGAMQDTTDGTEDFNVLVMDIVFGNSRIPDTLPCSLDPITLLEAFCMRINYERCQLKKIEDTLRQDEQTTTTEPNDDVTQIDKCFRRKYQTEINLSIEKFLKAEKIFNFLHPDPEVATMNLSVDKISTDVPNVPIKITAYTGSTKPKNP